MFSKYPTIWITGDLFKPSKLVQEYDLCLNDYFDSGAIENKKLNTQYNYGSARIIAPIDLNFEPQLDEFDSRITWLLNYIEDKISIIQKYGGNEFVLDIDYTLDLENRQQRYVDNLTVEQVKKMSELGITYNITIWVND